jgi:hypothetical protein
MRFFTKGDDGNYGEVTMSMIKKARTPHRESLPIPLFERWAPHVGSAPCEGGMWVHSART